MAKTRIYQRLMHIDKPDVKKLITISDKKARNVLALACRLAAYRIEHQRKICRHLEKIQKSPCVWDNKTKQIRLPPEALMPMDLLRALMASHFEKLKLCIFSDDFGLRGWAEVSTDFEKSAQYWAKTAKKLPVS